VEELSQKREKLYNIYVLQHAVARQLLANVTGAIRFSIKRLKSLNLSHHNTCSDPYGYHQVLKLSC
jgi:hypothetical protein